MAMARAKSAGMKSYFDDDEEEDGGGGKRPPPPASLDDDEDPLEAFMRANPLKKKGDDDEGFVGRAVKRPRTASERGGGGGVGGGEGGGGRQEEEVDPLDAFMAGVEDKVGRVTVMGVCGNVCMVRCACACFACLPPSQIINPPTTPTNNKTTAGQSRVGHRGAERPERQARVPGCVGRGGRGRGGLLGRGPAGGAGRGGGLRLGCGGVCGG